jgi:cobalamin synthase
VAAFVASRALGGATGDVYGATNKLVELVSYAALV